MKRVFVSLVSLSLLVACGPADTRDDDDDDKEFSSKDQTCRPDPFTGQDCADAGTPSTGTRGARCTSGSQCSAGEVCGDFGFGEKYCVKSCTADSECGANAYCEMNGSQGACLQRCTSDAACPGDMACIARPDTGEKICGPDMRGGSCFSTPDCLGTGFVCPGSAGSGSGQYGVCTADCTQNASVCGDSTTCVPTQSGISLCLRACQSAAECGVGHECNSGYCLPKVNSSPRPVGSACTTSTQCEGSLYCDTEFPGGYCTDSCTSDDECGTDVCIVVSSTRNMCMDKCYEPGTQSNCRDGYVCAPVNGQSFGVCVVN